MTYVARATGLEPATTRSTIGAKPFPQNPKWQRFTCKCFPCSILWQIRCLLHVLHVLNGDLVLLDVLLGDPRTPVSGGWLTTHLNP